MTQPLSPAARAVLDAAEDAYLANDNEFYNVVNNVAAAALRALADQVVPSLTDTRLATVHSRIFRIAAELEGGR